MNDDLPEPLVPPDCDLRGFGGFMLDTERLLASELVALATPEEAWHALMLWCRAWQQQPPGSLPNDDRVLGAFSRAGARWKKVRDMAMRGFILCSDGRLYHPVVCEQVLRAAKLKKAYRNDQERLRKWRENKRRNAGETLSETGFNDVSETPSETPSDRVSEQVREERRIERKKEPQKESKKEPPTPTDRHVVPSLPLPSVAVRVQDSAEFQQFWQKYPRREGKGAARTAFEKARKSATFEAIVAGLSRPWPADPQFVPHPATWLNQQRWLDEPPDPHESGQNPPFRNGFAALGARLAEQAQAIPTPDHAPLLTTENRDETAT